MSLSGNPTILITGCPPVIRNNNNFKQGYHLRCPNIIVNENTAMDIRSIFIAELNNNYIVLDWGSNIG